MNSGQRGGGGGGGESIVIIEMPLVMPRSKGNNRQCQRIERVGYCCCCCCGEGSSTGWSQTVASISLFDCLVK